MIEAALPDYGRSPKPKYVTLYDNMDHRDTLFQDTTLDMTYFRDQKAFLDTLQPEERLILKSYTYYGDRIINTMLRGGWTPKSFMTYISDIVYVREEDTFTSILGPLGQLNEENCLARVIDYIDRFRTVFNKVPVLTKPLRLFRGIEPNDTFNPGVQEMISTTMDYLSTAYDPIHNTILETYTGTQCCAYEFIVHPGVRALWIEPISNFPSEGEIIIEQGVTVINGCRNKKKLVYKTENDYRNRDVLVVGYDILPHDAKPPPIVVDTALGFGRHIYSYLCSTLGKNGKRGGKRRKTKRRNKRR